VIYITGEIKGKGLDNFIKILQSNEYTVFKLASDLAYAHWDLIAPGIQGLAAALENSKPNPVGATSKTTE
jgi:hypothetical protein